MKGGSPYVQSNSRDRQDFSCAHSRGARYSRRDTRSPPDRKVGSIRCVSGLLWASRWRIRLEGRRYPSQPRREEARHKQALADGAFSGKLPAIILSERTDGHYCLLIKIAGQSRIAWRPLIAALGLFRSAYSTFATIAWTPTLFTFGTQSPAAPILSDVVGYKLADLRAVE